MEQEEKQLLMKDLCGRLPYNFVYCYCNAPFANGKPIVLTPVVISNLMNAAEDLVIKPYLRPMSSMTEKETAEMSNIIMEWFDKELFYLTEEPMIEFALSQINYSISPKLFDWLNAHHIDYRGLIDMELALEAPEGMYKTE